MPPRVQQVLVGAAGVAIAVAMLWLGLWQMQVFESKENRSAQDRASQAAVPLLENLNADGSVGDVYGKRVSVHGSYLPGQQVLITGEDGNVRVLTGFELADGRLLPVVRGALTPDGQPSAPPQGEVEAVGVFMPSEAAAATPDGSVRLPALAQQWPQQLLPGFVTLDADAARAQGLEPAPLELLTGEGSWQNYGYALQWWVFAAFAGFMTIRFVRAIGRQGTLGATQDPAWEPVSAQPPSGPGTDT